MVVLQMAQPDSKAISRALIGAAGVYHVVSEAFSPRFDRAADSS
jgi:hypothetical protein